jgi:hypothetical protein
MHELLHKMSYLSFGFWTQLSGAKFQKSLLVLLTKFLNPEPSSIRNLRKSLCPRWIPSLNKRRVQQRFTYFGLLFLLIKNMYPAYIPAATSWHGLIDWTRQVGVHTKHCMRFVRGQSAYTVCWRIRGLSSNIVRRRALRLTAGSCQTQIKAWIWGSGVMAPRTFTSTLHGGEWPGSRTRRFTSWKTAPLYKHTHTHTHTHTIGNWVGHRARQDALAKAEISHWPESHYVSLTVQPIA